MSLKTRVDWDGTPTMYHHASISDQTSFACLFDSAGDSHDGITTPMEQIATIAIKRSQGEMRLQKLHKMFQMMRTPPALQSPAKKDHNEVWKACYDEQERYFKSLPMGGPATLLLDEPDRSLSLTNQMDFWAGIVPHLADRQTIIATHSPLIFFLDYPVNVIDLQQGYYAECKERFRKLKVS